MFWRKKADKEVVFDPQVVFERGRVICREFDDSHVIPTPSFNGNPYRKETRVVVFEKYIFVLLVFHSAKVRRERITQFVDDPFNRTEWELLTPVGGFEGTSLGGIDLIGYKK